MMGDPAKLRKKFSKPTHPFQKERIEEENKLKKEFGLKNKKEVWKAASAVRNYRFLARQMQADKSELKKTREKELMQKVVSLGMVKEGATVDDVLSLTVIDYLDRRLQTIVFKKALANTLKQARQLIIHGKIGINGRKCNVPGHIVTTKEEAALAYYGTPPQIEVKTEKVETAPIALTSKPSVPTTSKPIVPSNKPSVPEKKAESEPEKKPEVPEVKT